MAEETQATWLGKATAELKGVTAEQIWPFWEDFCNVHKWMPNIDACNKVEGDVGKPGLIRCCTSTTFDATAGNMTKWVKEKALVIDPVQRCLSYEVMDNNIGFKSYVATIKLLPMNEGGCKIEWSFVSDPVEGWKFEDLDSHVKYSLEVMAKRMEDAVLSG